MSQSRGNSPPGYPFTIDATSPRAWITAILSLVLVIVALKLSADGVGVEGMRALIAQAGFWAPILYVVVRASTYVIAPLSLPGIEITSGLLFGIGWGTALSVLGQTLGGSTNFWIARLLGRPIVARLAGRRGMERVDEMYDRVRGWRGLLFARLVLPGYDFLSYAAGLTPLRFHEYVIVTAVGGVPATMMHVALGATLAGDPVTFILATLGLGLLYGAAILAIQWFEARRRARTAESDVEAPAPSDGP